MEMELTSATVEPVTILAPSVPFDPQATGDAAFIKLWDIIAIGEHLDDETIEYLHLHLQVHWFEGDYRLAMDLKGDTVAQPSSVSTTNTYARTDDTDDKNQLPANAEISTPKDLAMKATLDRMRWLFHRLRALNQKPLPDNTRMKSWVYLYASNAAYGKATLIKFAAHIVLLIKFIRQDLDRIPMSKAEERALRHERLQAFKAATAKTLPWVHLLPDPPRRRRKPRPVPPKKPKKEPKKPRRPKKPEQSEETVQEEPKEKIPQRLGWDRSPLTAKARQQWGEAKDERRVLWLQNKLEIHHKKMSK